uniref:Uncharacterized protein n=1 Tax=Cacopsylla melanoneura TaxID=428564 RepID=A0A8D8ZNH8_9HEMI
MPPVVSESVWGSKWTLHSGRPLTKHGEEESIATNEGTEGGKRFPAGVTECFFVLKDIGVFLMDDNTSVTPVIRLVFNKELVPLMLNTHSFILYCGQVDAHVMLLSTLEPFPCPGRGKVTVLP